MLSALTKILYCSVGIFFGLTAGCDDNEQNTDINKRPDPMKEYRWNITESAPEEFMIQIVSGFFEAADGYQKGVPTRARVNEGWGDGRSWIAAGRESMPLPKRFEVTWFSWRENTFYHANFDLPFERLQQLVELDNRIPYTLAERPGNIFTLGLAPGGFIVVWLSSGLHNWEVFRGQAIEVEGVPWKAITENDELTREAYVKRVQGRNAAEFQNSPLFNDPEYWQRLHNEMYNYDIQIESEYTPYFIAAAFNNGERHKYYPNAQKWTLAPLSILEEISFDFFFPDELRAVGFEEINRKELSSAFSELSKENGGPLRVVVTIGDLLSSAKLNARLRIENDHRAIDITGYTFRRWGNASDIKKVKKSKELMRYMNYPNQPAQP